MKKKFLAILLAVSCVLSVTACAGKEENQVDSSIAEETEVADEEAVLNTESLEADVSETEEAYVEDEGYEYPSEDNTSAVQESEIGYSMTYDPSVFTLDDTGEADIFIYNTAEDLDAPIYISVQQYPDMDAQTLAEGLALQSGIDGVEVQDTYFGADGLETKNVYIEREIEGVKQIQVFYAIPVGDGSLLVEIGGYVGVPEIVEWKFEEMLGTFALKSE